MESTRNKSLKVASGVALILMLIAGTWGAWNARVSQSLRSERDQEKLRAEELLSEKLLVEKNLSTSESQLHDLVEKNETLSRQLEEAKRSGILNDSSIKNLQNQLVANKRIYKELVAANHALEIKLSSLNKEAEGLRNERTVALSEVETLRGKVDNLKKELALAHTSYYYDRVLVEASRGKKDKLVAKASRTKKLKATLMIPSAMKDVTFQIFDPSGNLISNAPSNGILAVRVIEDNNTVASTSGGEGASTYKPTEMTFIPKKKLASGTYRIQVLSENLLVGTLQVRLQ